MRAIYFLRATIKDAVVAKTTADTLRGTKIHNLHTKSDDEDHSCVGKSTKACFKRYATALRTKLVELSFDRL